MWASIPHTITCFMFLLSSRERNSAAPHELKQDFSIAFSSVGNCGRISSAVCLRPLGYCSVRMTGTWSSRAPSTAVAMGEATSPKSGITGRHGSCMSITARAADSHESLAIWFMIRAFVTFTSRYAGSARSIYQQPHEYYKWWLPCLGCLLAACPRGARGLALTFMLLPASRVGDGPFNRCRPPTRPWVNASRVRDDLPIVPELGSVSSWSVGMNNNGCERCFENPNSVGVGRVGRLRGNQLYFSSPLAAAPLCIFHSRGFA